MAEKEAEEKYAPQEKESIILKMQGGKEVTVYPDTFLFHLLCQNPKSNPKGGEANVR